MKPAPFTYHDPETLADATALLARLENARLLAGGQSLMPMMNFRLAMPDHLVDLNRIAELAGITVAAGQIRIGAMTRQRDIELSPEIARHCPVIHEALLNVGHCQTRNRGTIGGSLCHLDPSAELVNMTALHDGVLHAASNRGTRALSFAQFADGYMNNGLEPDEILAAISFAPWPRGHGHAFVEVARRHGDFAIAAVGALVETDAGGTIRRAAIAVSGLAPAPVRLAASEKALVGEKASHETFRAVAIEASRIEAMSDAYVTGEYRQHLARILTYRALETAAQRAKERVPA